MSRHGQVEITTPEPYRWGDGSDGSHVYGPIEYEVKQTYNPGQPKSGIIASSFPHFDPASQDGVKWVETTITATDTASPGYRSTMSTATYHAGLDGSEIESAGFFVGKKAWVAVSIYDNTPLGLDYFFLWNESTTYNNGVLSAGRRWGGWELVTLYTSGGTSFYRRMLSRESKVPFGVTPFTRMYLSGQNLYPYADRVSASVASEYSYRGIWYEDPFYTSDPASAVRKLFADNFFEYIYFEGRPRSGGSTDENCSYYSSAGIGKFINAKINGTKNFTDVVIRDNTELVPTGYPGRVIIFATKSITFGAGVRINANPTGTRTGANTTSDFGSAAAYSQIFSTGGGGGGGGANSRSLTATGGTSTALSYKRTIDEGANVSGSVVQSASGAGGGYRGNNSSGANGVSGRSADGTAVSFMKSFGYTMKGKYGLAADPYANNDDFPVLYGGVSGAGGKGGIVSTSVSSGSSWRRSTITYDGVPGGKNATGAGCIVLVAPIIRFADAPNLKTGGVAVESAGDVSNSYYLAPIPMGKRSDQSSGASGGTNSAYYQSDATLLYARGQGRGSSDNSNAYTPGSGSSSCYEEGVGGGQNGNSLNGTRSGDGGSASGGGGAGGSVVVIYNTLYGHPTIRTYGGQSGSTGGGGNRGGGGGHGGHGYYLIGWKGKQNGEISWVKEGNYGMRRGIHITSVVEPQGDLRSTSRAPYETYGTTSWPPRIDESQLIDAGQVYKSSGPNS